MTEVADLRRLLADSGGYSIEACRFIRDGLAHTVEHLHDDRDPLDEDESRHVSGQELCLGLRDYALQRYGRLAKSVLGRWGIRRTEDFGNIVFAMIEAGLMRQSEDDVLTDFAGVFDFDEEFLEPLAGSVGAAD